MRDTGNPPREPRVLAGLPPFLLRKLRSKLERSQRGGLAPNGTQQNRTEVWIQRGCDFFEFAIKAPELSCMGQLEQTSNDHHGRRCRGLRVNHQGRRSPVKRGVRQINVRMHDYHQLNNTTMLRMISVDALTFHRDMDRTVLPEFHPEVNPSGVPYSG